VKGRGYWEKPSTEKLLQTLCGSGKRRPDEPENTGITGIRREEMDLNSWAKVLLAVKERKKMAQSEVNACEKEHSTPQNKPEIRDGKKGGSSAGKKKADGPKGVKRAHLCQKKNSDEAEYGTYGGDKKGQRSGGELF